MKRSAKKMIFSHLFETAQVFHRQIEMIRMILDQELNIPFQMEEVTRKLETNWLESIWNPEGRLQVLAHFAEKEMGRTQKHLNDFLEKLER